ncbi:hypothetical protein LTR91_015301 [Friedmanniomyces endolithicus]|uniref:Uncharacterized protein n=1 Tax=Friedmanniomyces endolithicus TaxID=329885 RepID=A0AAN6KA59_9PEZI|nr:hypothetical protein LTR59_010410 [Friedmanniomyces endolithicus]KAK0799962.1 hypothetical protein LTR38_007362 [Friedmanniomyces endolithicus]KAK0800806.1 hypothetical protein LTR75_008806 [Friedmanniomyces endolithicus]KAK0840644.1 hypothetical protein LTR03_010443 [Friedmanniomyces endolithicus]KAK0868122.1 hypothetical protein LTR87_014291 [Friedmanniomyces endolithicus]
MALTNPSAEDALQLFKVIEENFPTQTLGEERWYILAVSSAKSPTDHLRHLLTAHDQISAITAGGHPGFAKDLYLYLISKPEFGTPDQRQALMRRLREALVKLVPVVGVPKPLEAVFSMGEVERDEDKDYSFSREHWQSGEANKQRGRDWLAQIYRHNDARTADMMAAQKDFRWLSIEITYGLYLSDHTILDGIDTELVVLSGIMMQNLARETGWHLRGTRRSGVSFEDVEVIQQCIEKVAAFCGLQLTRVPRVKDTEHEVDEMA